MDSAFLETDSIVMNRNYGVFCSIVGHEVTGASDPSTICVSFRSWVHDVMT